jgi:flagellar assembly factor FliW
MLVKTKHFGEIDLSEDKILTFDNGIMGFEEYKQYTILYDSDAEERPAVSWLQCCGLPELALPVVSPLTVKPDYNPIVEDELLKSLGDLNDENLVILLTLTVPADVKMMSVNLKAPVVINADTRKGSQVIAENPDYEIKHLVYEYLKAAKEGSGSGC